MIAALLAGAALSWGTLPSAPLERSEVAAARFGNFIYVVGGFEPTRTSPAVARHDIRHRLWKSVRSMPLAVNHPSAVAYGGDLYVRGGYAANLGLRGAALGRRVFAMPPR